MIYDLKYHGQAEKGEWIGQLMAIRHQAYGFFDGIDAIVPVPITRRRTWTRGYNQSEQVAQGISLETHIPIYNKVIRRQHFSQSQTHQTAMTRRTNVEEAFLLTDAEKIKGKHLLIVDDVVTTGATIIACAQELAKVEGVRISVLSIGLTKELIIKIFNYLLYLWLRLMYFRSEIKRKTSFPFVFLSLICTFALKINIMLWISRNNLHRN